MSIKKESKSNHVIPLSVASHDTALNDIAPAYFSSSYKLYNFSSTLFIIICKYNFFVDYLFNICQPEWLIIIECLLDAEHCSKYFMWIHLFNPRNSSRKYPRFYR